MFQAISKVNCNILYNCNLPIIIFLFFSMIIFFRGNRNYKAIVTGVVADDPAHKFK